MSNLELTTARDRAEEELRRLSGELADLQGRADEVLVRVATLREEQLAAARDLELGGGSAATLAKKTAALSEATARCDAVSGLVAEKRAACEEAQTTLTAATRDENEAKRQGEVAGLQAECGVIVEAIERTFEALALAAGDLELAVYRLGRLDRDAAAAVVDRVAGTALAERLARSGATAIVDAGGGSCGLGVPAVVRDPALARFDATVTAEIVLRERAAAQAPEQAA